VLAVGLGQDVLARATCDGRVGGPVLLGRRHWSAAAAAATGDGGAEPYLEGAGAVLVECADVADGDGVDAAPTLVG
jgi:CTP:molybdopterin cytidylyltransferase MocA